MKPCSITREQDQKLAIHVAREIAKRIKANSPIEVKGLLQDSYDFFTKGGMDEVRALTLVSIMPKFILAFTSRIEFIEHLGPLAKQIKDSVAVSDASTEDLSRFRSFIGRDTIEEAPKPAKNVVSDEAVEAGSLIEEDVQEEVSTQSTDAKADIERRRQEAIVDAFSTPISFDEFSKAWEKGIPVKKGTPLVDQSFTNILVDGKAYEYKKGKFYPVIPSSSIDAQSTERVDWLEQQALTIEDLKDKKIRRDLYQYNVMSSGSLSKNNLIDYIKGTTKEYILNDINAKYDAELAALESSQVTPEESRKGKRVAIQMQPANVEKIIAGRKTTTTRSGTQAKQIDIPTGESAVVNFGGKDFTVTNRGLLTIEEAGGKDAIIKSEGVKSEEDFMYKQTKDWLNGKGKLYVYDITPVSSIGVQGVDSISQIDFQEDQNTGYAERTKKNASADATIAIAIDFNTAGEKLTKKSVTEQNKKYIPVDGNNLAVTRERVESIVAALNAADAKSLNIAGNGIYTMNGKYTQEQVDNFTYELLKAVIGSPNLKNQIESIRTGGQTGFDEAGAKAGSKLGIPTTILAPKGWKFRDASGNDISNKEMFMARFTQQQGEVKAKIEIVERYTDADVKANPNKIYVFGDNTQRTGTGGQAQIRNNPNAMGIATKLAPSNAESAFMTDKDLAKNKAVIDGDIAKIKATGKDVVLPKDGLGTGLAKLKEKAPQTYEYLKQRLLEEFGFNNDAGTQQQDAVEISSKSSGLAGALTNPTELAKRNNKIEQSYPVSYKGKTYIDSEAAYQALKDDSEAKTKPSKEDSGNYKLMVDLIAAKLQQHPRLVSGITKQGGSEWILKATHQPTKKNTVWETGGQNWFIEALNDAYLRVKTEGIQGKEVKPGIVVNQSALSKEEQLELFDYLKPFIETQAAKTNKGKNASKMIGLGLRWDYKSNNKKREAVDIPDTIQPLNKTKYGYYTEAVNGEPLGEITPRFRELLQKATGIDMTNYDGAIINIYDGLSFISSHNDVDESKSASKYPVVGINLGGEGNFSVESRDGKPLQLDLQAGAAYVFGIGGVNREVWHRTFPKDQKSFLPEITTQIDGQVYPAGSYRVTVTMRRVKPLEQGMPEQPNIVAQSFEETTSEKILPPITEARIVSEPFSTTLLEASSGKLIDNPITVATGKFVRENILTMPKPAVPVISGKFERISFSSPYKMAIVHGSQIPQASRIQVNSVDLLDYSGPVIVFTDAAGNIVQSEGYTPHVFTRKPANLISMRNITQEKIDNYTTWFNNISSKMAADPTYKQMVDIAAATLGTASTTKEGTKPTPIKDIANLDASALESSLVQDKNNWTFTQPLFGYKIEVVKPNIIESPLFQTLKSLFESDLSLDQKKLLASEVFYINEAAAPFTEGDNLTDYLTSESTKVTTLNIPTEAIAGGVNVPTFNEQSKKWETVNIPVAQYIIDNFNTRLQLYAGSTLASPHFVIYYTMSDFSQSTGITSAEELNAQPETVKQQVAGKTTVKEITSEDDYLNLIRSSLKKAADVSNEATLAEIEAAEQWFKNSPLSKHIGFNNMMSIVNEGVLGEFFGRMITLYAGSNMTDIYHESWHGFSQRYLTKEQKLELYQEVIRLKGSMSYLEAEEYLAEAFRKYAMSGGKKAATKSSVINKIFAKIYNFFKSLFSNKSYSELMQEQTTGTLTDEYFNKLYIGDIAEFTPSDNNIIFGGSLYKSTIKRNGDNVNGEYMSVTDSKAIAAAIDNIIADVIHSTGVNANTLLANKDISVALYSLARKRFADMVENNERNLVGQITQETGVTDLVALQQLRERVYTPEDRATRNLLNNYYALVDALSNFTGNETGANQPITVEDIRTAPKNSTIGYHIAVSPIIKALEDVRKSQEGEVDPDDYTPFDRPGNDKSVMDSAKAEVAFTLRLARAKTIVNGKIETLKDRFGIPRLNNYGETVNKMVTVLIGEEGLGRFEDMYARLRKAAVKDPFFEDILNQIGPEDTQFEQQITLQTALFQNYAKGYSQLKLISTETKYDSRGKATSSVVVRVSDAPEDSRGKAELKTDYFNTATNYSTIQGTQRVTDLSAVLRAYPSINQNNVLDFVRDAGILSAMNGQTEAFILTPNIIRRLGYARNSMEKKIAAGKLKRQLTSPTSHNDTVIEAIHKYYMQSRGKDSAGRRLNPNNEAEYDYAYHNQVTRTIIAINAAMSLDDLLKNPATKHLHPSVSPQLRFNPFMNTLFDMVSGKRRTKSDGSLVMIESKNISGVINKSIVETEDQGFIETFETTEGSKNMQLDLFAKLHIDIHNMFKAGLIESVRASDKSTSLGVVLSSEVDPEGTKDGTVSKEKVFTKTLLFKISDFEGTGAIGNTKATRRLVDVLSGEIARMRSNPEDRSFTTINHEILLPSKLAATLIDKYVTSTDVPVENLSKAIVADPDIHGELNNNIKAFAQREYELMIGIINNAGAPNAKSVLVLDEDIQKENEALKGSELIVAMIKAMNMNYFFHQIAFMDMFAGGLDSYYVNRKPEDKTNSDYYERVMANATKRMAFTSNGLVFRSDANMQRHLNNKGRKYAASKGHTVRSWDGSLNTATLKDMEGSINLWLGNWIERNRENLSPEIIEAYESKVNRTDGQGYITFDAYRLLAIASNEWSPTQEALYEKVIANPQDETLDTKEFFPPRKYQYYGPDLNTGKKQVLHKFSLLPLVPNMVVGRDLEDLHNQMSASQIDYVTFSSGSKLHNAGEIINAHDEQGRIIEAIPFAGNETRVHTDYLKDQLSINTSFKGSSSRSVQGDKLAILGIFDEGKVVNPEVYKHYKNYLEAFDKLVEGAKAKLMQMAKNPQEFVDYINDQLDAKDVPQYIKDTLRVVDGKLAYPINVIPGSDVIERMAVSLIKKNLIKIKKLGEPLVQVSDAMFNRNQIEVDDTLAFYEVGKPAQVRIALQGEYTKLLRAIHPDGNVIKTLERLNEAIRDTRWKERNANFIRMNGVRIPVQGINSMEVFEVAEFLSPAAGNIIVVPPGLTLKSGGDFDIDKLTLYFPAISVTGLTQTTDVLRKNIETGEQSEITTGYISKSKLNKLQKANPNLDLSTMNVDMILDAYIGDADMYTLTEEDNAVLDLLVENKLLNPFGKPVMTGYGKKGLMNTMFLEMNNILLHPSNFAALVTPIGEDLIKDNSEIYQKLNEATKPDRKGVSDFFTYSYNLNKHRDNSIGKIALGMVAKANTLTALYQGVDVTMDSKEQHTLGYTRTEDGKLAPYNASLADLELGIPSKINLGSALDESGMRKSDTAGQLINPFVDMGKDPWIAKLNLDNISYPYYGFLRLIGKSHEAAMAFINTPAATEVFRALRLQQSPFGKLIFQETSGKRVIEKYRSFSVYKYLLNAPTRTSWLNLVEGAKVSLSDLKKTVSVADIERYAGTNKKMESKHRAFQLYQMLLMDRFIRNFNEVLFNFDVDTKQVSTFLEVRNVAANIESSKQSIVNPIREIGQELHTKTILRSFSESYDFGSKVFDDFFTRFSKPLFKEILKNYIHQYTFDYLKEVNNLTYKGLPIVISPGLKSGAFGSNNRITVDVDALQVDYNYRRSEGSTKRHFMSEREYLTYRLEVEYLRNKYENNPEFVAYVQKVGYKEALEDLSYRALDNILDSKLLKGVDKKAGFGYAAEWKRLTSNPETASILKKYAVGDMLLPTSSGILVLRSRIISADDRQALQEEILELQNNSNRRIAKFFKMLPIRAYYLHVGTMQDASILNIIPVEQVSRIMHAALQYEQESSEIFEEEFATGFETKKYHDNWKTYEGIEEITGDPVEETQVNWAEQIPASDEEVTEWKNKFCGQ